MYESWCEITAIKCMKTWESIIYSTSGSSCVVNSIMLIAQHESVEVRAVSFKKMLTCILYGAAV